MVPLTQYACHPKQPGEHSLRCSCFSGSVRWWTLTKELPQGKLVRSSLSHSLPCVLHLPSVSIHWSARNLSHASFCKETVRWEDLVLRENGKHCGNECRSLFFFTTTIPWEKKRDQAVGGLQNSMWQPPIQSYWIIPGIIHWNSFFNMKIMVQTMGIHIILYEHYFWLWLSSPYQLSLLGLQRKIWHCSE